VDDGLLEAEEYFLILVAGHVYCSVDDEILFLLGGQRDFFVAHDENVASSAVVVIIPR